MWSENQEIETLAQGLAPDLKVKFHDLPHILQQWAADYGGLKGKRVLDFGCGFGESAAGIAELLAPEMVLGVDINPESRECVKFYKGKLGRDGLPDNLKFQEIAPGEKIAMDQIDCIFSWSVFEHVNNRMYASILDDLVARMKPGGLFFVQISPLYFSPEGSHLWAAGYGKWEHLTHQTSDVVADVEAVKNLNRAEKDGLLNMYHTLNRITSDDLLERFGAAGLKLLRLQLDETKLTPPEALLRAYTRKALTTFQIVALFQKTDGLAPEAIAAAHAEMPADPAPAPVQAKPKDRLKAVVRRTRNFT
jgi:2-polyprenyl-3-methyl-5-hydroxy-6-metoxy-1,4-benzoquinol methylase